MRTWRHLYGCTNIAGENAWLRLHVWVAAVNSDLFRRGLLCEVNSWCICRPIRLYHKLLCLRNKQLKYGSTDAEEI
ncbi:hypothetical protein XENORESO_003831 [Xenotaenia resolanae]|uniref:Uncharacterized protein n=1 Tax=Xenotaenia resolanae TaxID=208358 RepID=A0ABV0WK79_9TELE